jgi:DNA-binding transcriptional ArsR family regulator
VTAERLDMTEAQKRAAIAAVPPPEREPAPTEAEDRASLRADVLRSRLVGADRLGDLPMPVPIIGGASDDGATLVADSLAWLYGKPGSAKSFVALDIACSVATGVRWHGRSVVEGVVLYVLAEGAAGMAQRVSAWESWHRVSVPAGQLWFLPVAVQLGTADDVAGLAHLVAELRPSLIVVDTQARSSVGLEENSAKDMGLIVAALDVVRRACGACVLVVHHIGRAGETLRGSTAIDGAAETLLRCEKDGTMVRLDIAKQKNYPEDPPMTMRLTASLDSVILDIRDCHEQDRELSPLGSELLAALGSHGGSKGMSSSALQAASGLKDRTFYRALKALRDNGHVTRDDSGRFAVYRVADAAQGVLLP